MEKQAVEELIKELEIFIKIDEDDDIEEIKKNLNNKSKHFCGIIDEIINPDTSFKSMHESGAFSEKEKIELYEVYKKMQSLEACYNLTELKIDDKDNVDYINAWLKTWKENLDLLNKTVSKIKHLWEEKEDTKKEFVGYLG